MDDIFFELCLRYQLLMVCMNFMIITFEALLLVLLIFLLSNSCSQLYFDCFTMWQVCSNYIMELLLWIRGQSVVKSKWYYIGQFSLIFENFIILALLRSTTWEQSLNSKKWKTGTLRMVMKCLDLVGGRKLYLLLWFL